MSANYLTTIPNTKKLFSSLEKQKKNNSKRKIKALIFSLHQKQ